MPLKLLFVIWVTVFIAAGLNVLLFQFIGWPALIITLVAACGLRLYGYRHDP